MWSGPVSSPSLRRSFHGGQDAARQMLEAAEADLALEAGFVHVKARQAFPEIGRQVRRREQTAFRASRWRRRSCRALPDAPAPPKAAGPSEGVGPRVRIRLAPARSQVRTCVSRTPELP